MGLGRYSNRTSEADVMKSFEWLLEFKRMPNETDPRETVFFPLIAGRALLIIYETRLKGYVSDWVGNSTYNEMIDVKPTSRDYHMVITYILAGNDFFQRMQ